jgi:hypothetical protein
LTCLLGRNQSFQDTPPNLFVNFLSYTTFDHNSKQNGLRLVQTTLKE